LNEREKKMKEQQKHLNEQDMNEKITDLEEKINEQETEIEKLNNLLSEYKEKCIISERELQYKRTYSASLFEEKEKLEEKILKYKKIVKMREHEQESKKNEKGNTEKYKDSISQLQKDKIKLQEENHQMQEALKNISSKMGLMMEEKDKSDEYFMQKIKQIEFCLEKRNSFDIESNETNIYEKKVKEIQETYNLIIQSKIEEIQTTQQQNQEANKIICNLRNQISQKEQSIKELNRSVDSFRSQLSKEKENNSNLQKNMEIHSIIEKSFTDEKSELELLKKKFSPESESQPSNEGDNNLLALQEKKIYELIEQISLMKKFDEERALSFQKSLQDNLKVKEDLEKSQSELSKLTQQNNLLRFEKDELEQKFLNIRNPIKKNGKTHYKSNNSWLRYLPVVNLFLPKNNDKILVNGLKNGKK
jgi:uncharacterized coiled-coil protein SlyX